MVLVHGFDLHDLDFMVFIFMISISWSLLMVLMLMPSIFDVKSSQFDFHNLNLMVLVDAHDFNSIVLIDFFYFHMFYSQCQKFIVSVLFFFNLMV
jgi:hypothetical protein